MVSIIIPVYNAEKHLSNAIGSIQLQDYSNWEAIIIDDGSTDASGEVGEMLSSTDDRIQVFHIANSGVTAARNTGVSKSSGEWICFLDADDELMPNSLSAMIASACDCDIVIGNKQIVTGEKHLDELVNLQNEILTAEMFLSRLIKNEISQYITGRIFRKELFEDGSIRIPPELNMAEDFIMNVQLGNKSLKVSLIQDVVYRYYVYDISVSHTFRSSLLYEQKFCAFLEKSVKEGPHYLHLQEALAFQNLRALKQAFLSQRGAVDLHNPFLCQTYKDAKHLPLTRGWKAFLWLIPYKRIGYYILLLLDRLCQ